MRPRVGFHASAWGSEHLLAALSGVAQHGFDGTEVYADTSHVFADNPGEFATILDITGVGLSGLHSGGVLTDPDFHEAELAEWERLLEWVKITGGEYAIYYGGEPTDDMDADIEHGANLLDQIGELAAARGVRFCYEPDARGPFQTKESVAFLLARTDPKHVGLSIDTAHIHAMGVDPALFVLTQSRRLHVVHVRDVQLDVDAPNERADPYVDPGEGSLDLMGIADALRSTGFAGWIVGVVDNPRQSALISAGRTAKYFRDFLQLEF